MINGKTLSLSNKYEDFSNYENVVLVDDIFYLKKIEKLKKIRIIKNQARDRKHINSVYSYCEKIYSELLQDISIQLNILHGLKNNQRYWEILVGNWLIDFILVCHKSFFNIHKRVLKNNKYSKCIILKTKNHTLHTLNTIEAANATINREWNFALNSKIVEFLSPKIKFIYKSKKFKNFRMRFNNFESNNFDKIKKLKLINNLVKNKEIFIYKTSLSFLEEKKLEIKLGQIPTYWETKEPIYAKFSNKIRKKIKLDCSKKDKKDKFNKFLRKEIPSALPIFLIESFKKNLNLSKKLDYPDNPKKIFTCVAYQGDELFKIYLAEKIKNKTQYFCGQHGNNYFTAYQSRISLDVKTSDKFLSWGYKNSKKGIIPVSNIKCIGKINKKKLSDPKGKLLILFDDVGLNRSPIERNDLDYKKLASTFSIINDFNTKLKKNSILRIRKSHLNEFNSFYFKKFFENIPYKLDIHKSNIRDLQSISRLNYFNYYSTGMLENFVLNIPTVCFLDKDLEFHNTFLQKKLKYLEEAKIVFYDKKKFIKHVINIWNDVNFWWKSKKTQNLIKKFNANFNLSNNSVDNLVRILKND